MDEDVLYKDDDYTLFIKDKKILLRTKFESNEYTLSSHYYEPCTYIEDKAGNKAVLHSGFDLSFVVKELRSGKDLSWYKGKMTPHQFCELMIDTLNDSLKGGL